MENLFGGVNLQEDTGLFGWLGLVIVIVGCGSADTYNVSSGLVRRKKP